MIEHQGIIQAVSGGRVKVAVETGGCRSCAKGCGIGQLAKNEPITLLDLPAPNNAQVGLRVTVRLPEESLARSALLGYLFPTVTFIGGAVLGSSGGDSSTALGAVAGLVIGLFILQTIARIMPSWLPSPQLIPSITLENHPRGN